MGKVSIISAMCIVRNLLFTGCIATGLLGTACLPGAPESSSSGFLPVILQSQTVVILNPDHIGSYLSCKEILTWNPGIPSGFYDIDPDGDAGAAYTTMNVFCEMLINGGGWTRITTQMAHDSTFGNGLAGGGMVAVTASSEAALESNGRLRTYDNTVAYDFTYHYTFDVPMGFTDFYLSDYTILAYSPATCNPVDYDFDVFNQTTWNAAHGGGGWADIALGVPTEGAPRTTYTTQLGSGNVKTFNCAAGEQSWPNTNVTSGASSTQFRLGWGEGGNEAEGLYPWYNGYIMVR